MDISAVKVLLTICALQAGLLVSLTIFLICMLVCRSRPATCPGGTTAGTCSLMGSRPTVDNWLLTLSLTGGGFFGTLTVVYLIYNGLGFM